MTPDLCNGLFETLGAVFLFGNIQKLRQHREVKGVDWKAVAFFFAWGCFNLWFYPTAGLFWSFCGGILIAVMNLVWLLHVGCYWLAKNRNLQPVPATDLLADSRLETTR